MNRSIAPSSNGANLKFVADQFARGFQELRDAVNNIQTQVQAGAIDMARVRVEIDNIQERVDKLHSIVRGNNGNSIQNKLITIENELKYINEWISTQKEKKAENLKYKIQVKIAMIAGSFALITTVVAQIARLF